MTEFAPALSDFLLPTAERSAPARGVSSRSRRFAYGALTIVVAATLGFVALSNRNALRPRHDNNERVDDQLSDQRERENPQRFIKKDSDKCSDDKYPERTLKIANELPFAALFKDTRGQKKFEASDVVIVGDASYSVCDSSYYIAKVDSSNTQLSDANILIGDMHRGQDNRDDSGYEAIFHDNGVFYAVRESVKVKDESGGKTYRAIIEELVVNETEYEVQAACPTEFEFEGMSKGIEGAVSIRDVNDSLIVLGLCEGNYCSESRKDDKGHGRLLAMKKEVTEDGCTWKTIKTIKIPKSANFLDYSAITMTGSGRVAISSQEESEVWIGQLKGLTNGHFDAEKTEFDKDIGEVYSFPKTMECRTMYCNIEGIHFVNDHMLLAVSDKMKGGKQDFRCFDKDQSIHAFVLPPDSIN